MAGGDPHPGGGAAVFATTRWATQGSLGTSALKKGPAAANWTAGEEVEVSWGIRANHGGGYQVREHVCVHMGYGGRQATTGGQSVHWLTLQVFCCCFLFFFFVFFFFFVICFLLFAGFFWGGGRVGVVIVVVLLLVLMLSSHAHVTTSPSP